MRKARELVPAGGVFAFFLAVYFLTTNQNFSFDAVTHAIAAEANEPARWFHSNHLLYPFLGVLWFRFERLLGFTGSSLYSLARFNSLLMAGSLAVLFHALAPAVGRGKALVAAFFLGGTYAFWHYAVDAQAIGSSSAFSALVVSELFRLNKQERLSIRSCLPISLFSLLAILMHGIALFQIFPVAAWLWKKQKGNPRAALVYLGGVLGVLLLLYTAVYFFISRPYVSQGFLSWALGSAGYLGASNIAKIEFWANGPREILSGLWSGWCAAFLFPGNHFIGVIMLGVMIAAFAKSSALKSGDKALVRTLLVWGGLEMGFLAFWSTGHPGYRLHVLIPWVPAAVVALAESLFVFRLWAVLAALLFSFNFKYTIYPDCLLANNAGYRLLQEIRGHLQPGDLFLSLSDQAVPNFGVYRPYFNPEINGGSLDGRLYAFRETSLEPLRESLQRKAGGGHSVFFASDLYDPAHQEKIEKRFGFPAGSLASFLNSFDKKTAFGLSNGITVFQVRPKR